MVDEDRQIELSQFNHVSVRPKIFLTGQVAVRPIARQKTNKVLVKLTARPAGFSGKPPAAGIIPAETDWGILVGFMADQEIRNLTGVWVSEDLSHDHRQMPVGLDPKLYWQNLHRFYQRQ